MLTIYLVQSGERGPVKVALTSGTALQRLQAGNPEPLIVRAIYEAQGREDLQELHEAWAAHHVRGDWYTPPVLEETVDLRRVQFDEDAQTRRLDADEEQERVDRAARLLAHYARTRP